MKKIILLAAVSLPAFTLTSNAQTAAEIISKHNLARGGTEKMKTVKSIVSENIIAVQGMEFENKSFVVTGKAVRSESKIMGSDMVQAYDGQTAWAITPVAMGGTGEAGIMPAEMSSDVISQIDPFPLLDFTGKETKVELLGTDTIKEKKAYHLKATTKEGIETESWISAENYMLVKLKTKQNGQPVELFFTKYKEIEGMQFPQIIETSNPMAGTIIIENKAVILNSAIDESIFIMPAKK